MNHMKLLILLTPLILLAVVSVVFLTLKLSGAVTWSWWCALAPVLIILVIAIIIAILLLLASKFAIVQ
jgi:hypothetical protein